MTDSRNRKVVYKSEQPETASALRALCNSIEEVNRVWALEEFHLTTTIVEPLQTLVEHPVVVAKSYKNMVKVY